MEVAKKHLQNEENSHPTSHAIHESEGKSEYAANIGGPRHIEHTIEHHSWTPGLNPATRGSPIAWEEESDWKPKTEGILEADSRREPSET